MNRQASAEMSQKLFRAKLLTPEGTGRPAPGSGFWRLYDDGALVIDTNGRIVSVGDYADLAREHSEAEKIDLSDKFIVPGFIDAHVHLPQYPAIGLYGRELLDWLNAYIFPAEKEFTPKVADSLSPIFFDRLLAYGVTTAAIYTSVRADSTWKVFEWAERKGIRAIIGKVMMDRNVPDYLREDTRTSIAESDQLCKAWHGQDDDRLLYAFTPRFAPSCSQELLDKVGALARERGAYVQTHLSENSGEIKWVKQLFPESRNYTDVYARAGLLGPKTLLAHAIHIDQDEQRALLAAEACLVHCPTSNLFLKSGLMHLAELLQMRHRVGLGSDVAGGPTLSPFSLMQAAIYVHNARCLPLANSGFDVTPGLVLYLATLGGARALGLGRTTGSLEPGKDADFVVLDLSSFDQSLANRGEGEVDKLLSRLVFLSDDRNVEQTYVRGRLCYERQQRNSAKR